MVFLAGLFFLVFYFCLFLGFVWSFFGVGYVFDFFLFNWLGVDLSFSFVFDFVSLGFFGCVSFISGVVFFYSVFYMAGTVDFRRFVWLVFLFVFSMFLLVFSGNFFLVMVGWDGLGLVSFCLVIFYSNSSSLVSGLVTVFSNRVGDVFFLLSFLFFGLNGVFSWDLSSFGGFELFFLFIFLGAITKSAQVPFSAWLPAAMAAPTPVSSLVHSSTLVTAGVYVLIRFNYLFVVFDFLFLKAFFLFTMILAGACAVVETDLKKVVAMSTLSQLGMMMFVLSVGGWIMSFVHMLIHAFFKSMLFLSTGSLMSQAGGSQDTRFYGLGFSSYVSFLFFVVSCLCLSGFPFFLGFYSKDFIISSVSWGGLLFYLFFVGGCVLTVVYSFRLIHGGYVEWYKFVSHGMFSESVNFFFFSYFLFLKCWFFGGFVYWFFLSNMVFFFTFLDLFLGILIFLAGLGMFFFLKFFYSFFLWFCFILFLRWGAGLSLSSFFPKMTHVFFEVTWMEVMGGMGVYSSLSGLSSFLSLFGGVSVGVILIVFILLNFYIFWL